MEAKDSELLGFDKNIEEKEVLNNQNYSFFRKNRIYIFISISVLIIATIIILSVYLAKDKDKDNIDDEESDSLLNHYTCKAVFYTETNNSNISLGFKKNDILEMKIDGINVNKTSYYIFNYAGNHTVYVLLDMKKMNSFSYYFYGNKH